MECRLSVACFVSATQAGRGLDIRQTLWASGPAKDWATNYRGAAAMKNLCDPRISKYRDGVGDVMYGTDDSDRHLGGAFIVPHKTRGQMQLQWLRVIASSGSDQPDGWRFDHVSVSLANRAPTWEEMDYVKRMFFHPDEVCYQLHVADADHINNHPYCLHIWRSLDSAVALPPAEMVGLCGLEKAVSG